MSSFVQCEFMRCSADVDLEEQKKFLSYVKKILFMYKKIIYRIVWNFRRAQFG